MKTKFNIQQFTILGLMIALLLLMSFTPLGYLHLGAVDITLNMIPVAIAAIAVGPAGGLIAGSVFGITSFLQCIGIGGLSAFGAALFAIDPLFTVILCIVPRALTGLLLGWIYRGIGRLSNRYVGSFVTGFFSAFLNTLFFMTFLMLLFGSSDFIREMQGGMNLLLFVCVFVGINFVFEVLASTLVTGAVGSGLCRARILPEISKKN